MSLGRLDRVGSFLASVVDDHSLLSGRSAPRSLGQSIAEVVRVSLDPLPGLERAWIGAFRARNGRQDGRLGALLHVRHRGAHVWLRV